MQFHALATHKPFLLLRGNLAWAVGWPMWILTTINRSEIYVEIIYPTQE
jgi:hypothetical protein